MNSQKKPSALVSVLLNGEPFLFVLLMFCGLWLCTALSEQIGSIIPYWLATGFSILLTSALMALIYPKPVWWLAFVRYAATGIVTGILVTYIVNDLVDHESIFSAFVMGGLTEIWKIVEGVKFPEAIVAGMVAIFLSTFWMALVIGFFLIILMVLVALIFGLMNMLLLIWFKPIFERFEERNNAIESKLLFNQQSGKNKWIALLFCMLGFVAFVHGLHRIYTGRYITGIIQLITFGGFFLWTLSDVFLILTGNFVTKQVEDKPETIDNQFIG